MSVGASSWTTPTNAGINSTVNVSPLFICDICQDQIPAQKARIHCQSCQDFDLCASCFVTGATAGSHASHHPTAVIRMSGVPSIASPSPQSSPSSYNEGYQAIPQPRETAAASTSNTGPTGSSPVNPSSRTSPHVGQPPYFPPPPGQTYKPPPPPPRPVANGHQQKVNTPPPSLPPRQTYTSASGIAATNAWQPLFNGNIPSPIFLALLNDIFTHLDPGRTNYLTPEAYSGFLDVQGYSLDHNVWKKSLTPVFGQNKEDIADCEWKSSLENFSIEHVMAPRRAAANNDMSNLISGMNNVYLNTPGVQQILQASQPRSVSGGQMPLMTRKGFIDITTIEVLYDPSAGWNNLNGALRTYRLWQDKGPIPRDMLPAFPPQVILDQVKRIGEMARIKAQNQLNAKRAEVAMKQRGQQYALDLLDDRRYYYY